MVHRSATSQSMSFKWMYFLRARHVIYQFCILFRFFGLVNQARHLLESFIVLIRNLWH